MGSDVEEMIQFSQIARPSSPELAVPQWRKGLTALLRLWSAATIAVALPLHAATDPDASKMPTAPMREQVLHLPGDPTRPVTLEATLFEPPGGGPFPLAVMNHGANGDPRSAERYRVSFSIDYLLSRGYAVIVPMMRGFAGSGGRAVLDGCDDARIGKLNAADILAVIAAMRERQEVDANHILVMGQSFGGWNSLALATMAPPEVKGIVNFVGGIRAGRCTDQDWAMWTAMEEFGREARVPSLWFYGNLDDTFPPAVWRVDYEHFTRAGGQAKLVDFGDVADAHNFLGYGDQLDLWVHEVDEYLGEQGLPNREIYPEYLPTPRPSPTNYATIGDVAAVPFIGRAKPDFYRKFLNTKERPRALVVSAEFASLQTGGFDPIVRAMAECGSKSAHCILYAYDDDVVWTGPEPGQTARINDVLINARAVRSGELVVIRRLAALSPSCEPQPLPAASITQAPAHGTATIEAAEEVPSFKPPSPLTACNGSRVPVLRLNYQSAPDFRGVDFLTLRVREKGNAERISRYAIRVE
jgi:dienelactone hydrolase